MAADERRLALQQDHAAVERQAPDARFGQAEGRFLRRDDDVAAKHHLESAAERVPVDARDHRHVERLAQRDAAEPARARQSPNSRARSRRCRPSCRRRSQKARSPVPVSTTTRTSRLPSISVQIFCSSRSDGGVDGVEHVRPVDGDACDVILRSANRIGISSAAFDARRASSASTSCGVLAERRRRDADRHRRIRRDGSASPPPARSRPRRAPPGSCR